MIICDLVWPRMLYFAVAELTQSQSATTPLSPERVTQVSALVGCFTQAWKPLPGTSAAPALASPRK